MKKYVIFTFIIAVLIYGSQAQIVDTAHFQLNYVPHLQNFQKINYPAKIVDTVQEKVVFDYDISPQPIDITFAPNPIKAMKVLPEPMQRFHRNFLKVGFGYPVTPLLELVIHNGSNKNNSFGMNVHHFSSWAKPIGKKMKQYAYYPLSDTKAKLFFTHFFKKQTLYSSIGYNHLYNHFYGFRLNESDKNIYQNENFENSLKTHFHHATAEVGLRSNYTLEDRALKQDVRLNYSGIFTNHKDMENHVGLNSFLAYDARWLKISGSQLYRLNFNFDYYNNRYGQPNDSTTIPTTNAFLINPELFAHWTFNEYHILVGIGASVGTKTGNDNAAFTLYPIAELQLGVIQNILSIYAGVKGDMFYNAYEKLLYENPFIKPQLTDLRYTKNWIHIYGGVKGNLVKKLNYNVFAQYTYSQNMLFYALDTNLLQYPYRQFNVVYDDGGYLNVGLNVNWEVLRDLHLLFDANYWLYHLNNLEKPWHKPMLAFGFSGKYFFKDMLIFHANFHLDFGRYAAIPTREENGTMYYNAQLMKPILDFGIGAEWLINKQFTAFLNIHNIAGQHYTQFYDYPNLGINAMAGITYSFGEQSMKRAKR